MGFYSFDCKHCGHPALSRRATDRHNKWMNDVVALFENGKTLVGDYDGYGRVSGIAWEWDEPVSLYHQACWETCGKPKFDGPSKSSEDQGWFFDKGVHDSPPPGEEGFFRYE